MITEKMTSRLNQQIALEGYASFLYLSMVCWCDDKGLVGCAQFMYRQSDEERMHMMKIFEYLGEVDKRPKVPAIAEPPADFDSVDALFEQVYAHEQKVTRSIHELVAQATEENDFGTLHFLQWYVAEQREEEALIRTVLDRMKLLGEGPMRLYYIDKEVQSLNKMADAEEA
ncbi:MAG: ferritin [Saprospiraceae bacterium]